MPAAPRPLPRAHLAWLALAGAAALAVRLAIVARLPDADTDAYGHFAIGRALVRDPANLVVHWVWLPGYHYAIWALLHLGVGFTGVRVVNAVLQAGAPFLLRDLVARRTDVDPARAARVALVAALAWTAAPLPNLLATSAQAETSFTLLVLAAAWAVERRRPALAGALLAGASLTRYEAWGAIAALALHRMVRRREGPGLASFALPLVAVAAWLALRRGVDGEWLLFLRQTREFALGLDRYYTSLVPFACAAIAEGALRVPELARRVPARAAAGAAIVALALTTGMHLRWLVRHAVSDAAALRGHEADVTREPPS